MSEAKNQHFVPRSYLKRFTHDGSQTYVFDKVKKLTFPSNINKIASGKYFYNLPQEINSNVDPFLIEKVFSQLETKYGNLLAEIIDGITVRRGITKNQKQNLAIHLGVQILRTREFRDSYIELSKKAREAIFNKFLKLQKIDTEAIVSIGDNMIPAEHARMIFDPESLGILVPFLSDCIWMVGINMTEQPFYTSDTPIVKEAHLSRFGPSFTGWLSPGVEIAFPLSSKLVLTLYNRNLFNDTGSRAIQQIAEGMDGNLIPLEADHIKRYNSLQVIHSYRQIYCEADSFELALKICNEHPQVCNPDRPRWKSID